MPHICTRCNSVFESGEDILKGCPSCGWKKFMFVRKVPKEADMPAIPQGQLITSAMGVRKPPRGADMKLEMAREGQSIKKEPSHGEVEKALESVKITAPGTYELNLPSLFERDELIMAVKEGTYFIDLTSAFKKSKKD